MPEPYYTNKPPDPVHDVTMVEKAIAEIDPEDLEEILKAKLPLIQNPRKANYLTWRATGFGVREACALAEINQGTVKRWRREDPEFAAWEVRGLTFLQRDMADDINRAEFNRNFRLDMRLDYKVLLKANRVGPDNLTQREFQVLQKIQGGKYSPAGMLALDKTRSSEGGSGGSVNVVVNVGDEAVASVEANRAASRELLQRFTATAKYVNQDRVMEIEGKVKDAGTSD